MNQLTRFASTILIVMIVVYCGWYLSNRDDVTTLNQEELSTTVDATATRLSVKQFDATGTLVNQLSSPEMQHIPKGNIHWFKNPKIIVVQDEKPAWNISARRAKSIEGGQRIVFMKQVVVHQNAGADTPESTLKTERITYYPDRKKAMTKALVTFEQPGNSMQSMGMNAYLAEKRVELLHRAKGIYDPKKG